MGARELPGDLARARSRFAAWRAGRQRGERIQASLWTLAVRVGKAHGLSRTVTALRDVHAWDRHT